RDFHVTGVQTCALPIWPRGLYRSGKWNLAGKLYRDGRRGGGHGAAAAADAGHLGRGPSYSGKRRRSGANRDGAVSIAFEMQLAQIGSESCRERGTTQRV